MIRLRTRLRREKRVTGKAGKRRTPNIQRPMSKSLTAERSQPIRSQDVFLNLPVAVFGNSLTKVTLCGALKCARFRPRKLAQLSLICACALLENNKGVRRLAACRQSTKVEFIYRKRLMMIAVYVAGLPPAQLLILATLADVHLMTRTSRTVL